MVRLNLDSGLKDIENYVHCYTSTMRTHLFKVSCEEMSSQPASGLSLDSSSFTLSCRKLHFPYSSDHQLLVQLDNGRCWWESGGVRGREKPRYFSSFLTVACVTLGGGSIPPRISRSSLSPLQQEADPTVPLAPIRNLGICALVTPPVLRVSQPHE